MWEWVSIDAHKKSGGREWPYYSGKKHRIIIEEYMQEIEKAENPVEYKFFCFGGKPVLLYVLGKRKLGNGVELGVFNGDFVRQDAERADERPLDRGVAKPKNFERMKEIATVLSSDFPEARIDMYNLDGEMRFGEITFFDGSGYMTFKPDKFDEEMGEKFNLPNVKKGIMV